MRKKLKFFDGWPFTNLAHLVDNKSAITDALKTRKRTFNIDCTREIWNGQTIMFGHN